MTQLETPQRIQPALLEETPVAVTDAVAELSAASATLGKALHPRTAANLADLVRIMNTYYSNLIEGHRTRPRDIQRALAGKFDQDEKRRHLQIEAAAHVRLQTELDKLAVKGQLLSPHLQNSFAGSISNSTKMRLRGCLRSRASIMNS